MTTVAVIQARNTSTRLPGKVVLPLAGVPVVTHIAERMKATDGVDVVCAAIPDSPGQEPLAELVESLDGVVLVRGPEDDILRRFAMAAEQTQADIVLRLFADCPAIDCGIAANLIAVHVERGGALTEVSDDSGYPWGYECQAISVEALMAANGIDLSANEREDFPAGFARYPDRFPMSRVYRPAGSSKLQILLDTPADYEKLNGIFEALYPVDPLFGFEAVETLARERPELFAN